MNKFIIIGLIALGILSGCRYTNGFKCETNYHQDVPSHTTNTTSGGAFNTKKYVWESWSTPNTIEVKKGAN